MFSLFVFLSFFFAFTFVSCDVFIVCIFIFRVSTFFSLIFCMCVCSCDLCTFFFSCVLSVFRGLGGILFSPVDVLCCSCVFFSFFLRPDVAVFLVQRTKLSQQHHGRQTTNKNNHHHHHRKATRTTAQNHTAVPSQGSENQRTRMRLKKNQVISGVLEKKKERQNHLLIHTLLPKVKIRKETTAVLDEITK